jgi:hypothetical protein
VRGDLTTDVEHFCRRRVLMRTSPRSMSTDSGLRLSRQQGLLTGI